MNAAPLARAVALGVLAALLLVLSPLSAIAASSPTVNVREPKKGATLKNVFTLKAAVADTAPVLGVDYYVDGSLVGTGTVAPEFRFAWDTKGVSNGQHAIYATAHDANGLVFSSPAVTFNVKNAVSTTPPPTAAMVQPWEGEVLASWVGVKVAVVDSSTVLRVDYFVDDASIGSGTVAPEYRKPWDSHVVPDGPHRVYGTVYDLAGRVFSTPVVTFTVQNGTPPADTSPPTVSLAAPTAGSVVAGDATLSATAADDVGVTAVDFLVDGAAVAHVTAPPWSAVWPSSTVTDGSHDLAARAFDAAGHATTSDPVTVTVDNAPPSDTTPPMVSLVSPTVGSILTGTTGLGAVATDDVGVTGVDFLVDGAVVAHASSPPWTAMWDSTTVGDGRHAIAARAFDAAGHSATSGAVEVAVQNTPVQPPPDCAPPYSASSPWNTPIGSAPAIHPNSDFYVSSMTPTLTSDPTQYTYPVYYADASSVSYPVKLSGRFSNVTTETSLQNLTAPTVSVPIPPDAVPAVGSDGQVVVVKRDTGDEWGFWQLHKDTSGNWLATNGYHYNVNFSGVPPTGFGSRGGGIPYLAGLVRPCEIAQGHIDHALAFAYDYPTSSFIFPATKSDGKGTLSNDMPEGARLQLDPSLTAAQLGAFGITGPALTIARALQTYGMYITDNSGREKLIVEYEGTAHWSGLITASTVSAIPLSMLRWVDQGSGGGGGGPAVAPANTAPPTIGGAAQAGLPLTATVGSWTGTEPLDFAYEWQRCDGTGSACNPVGGTGPAVYIPGTADVGSTFRVLVTAKNTAGAASALSAATPVVTAAPPTTGDPVVAAAGDIASSGSGDTATAAVVASIGPTAVLTLGDNAYSSGTASEFQNYYAPTWGAFKAITHPAPGNHDYRTANAAGYFGYFGSAAGDPTKGYYSFDLGAWHVVALNTNGEGACNIMSCSAGSAQEQWLRADLAAHPNACTLAYWHHPRFSAGSHGDSAGTQALWKALVDYHVDIALAGHDHDYQRYAPLNASGAVDAVNGVREFVSGAGGEGHYAVGSHTGLQASNGDTSGVLELTLHPAGYDWAFVPVAGGTYTDSGSDSCR
jgi:Big-like domain-containing protein/calcineurin-like phosphoesterase family protein